MALAIVATFCISSKNYSLHSQCKALLALQ